MNKDNKKKSVEDLINDASEILKNSTAFYKITIEGKKTNIVIEKPEKNEDKEA